MKTETMDTIRKIIGLFMNNPVSGSAQVDFETWLTDGNNQDKKSEILEEQWTQMEQSQPSMRISVRERERRLSKLHKRLGLPAIHRHSGIFVPWWAAAAVAAVLLVLPTIRYFSIQDASNIKTTCLVSPLSGKGDFILPDGTQVCLNSAGKIEYGEDFLSGRTRTVKLEGEAFFNVTRTGSPFIVEMGGIDVTVLGTSFNARNTSHYDDYQVTLVDGSVSISGDTFREISLMPGQQFSCSRSLKTPTVRRVNTSNHCSWTGTSLEFDNMTLGEIATNLEHWYNMKFEFAPETDKNVRISLKLKSETLEEALGLIEKVTGYSYRVDDSRTCRIKGTKQAL